MSDKPAIIVTGATGFAGIAICKALVRHGHKVVGLVRESGFLQSPQAAELIQAGITLRAADMTDAKAVGDSIEETSPEVIIHLAAQASPQGGNVAGYVENNIGAFSNMLQAATEAGVKHVLYASTYGLYGLSNPAPQREDMPIAPPPTLYASTKYANELLAHAMPADSPALTGLRFFNLYGQWQRPDTMPAFFARKLLAGETVPLFAEGTLVRDFIEVDDAAEAVATLVATPAEGHRIFNIGSGEGVTVQDFVGHLANAFNVEAKLDLLPARAVDHPSCYADITALSNQTGWKPSTRLADGLACFAAWYKQQHS